MNLKAQAVCGSFKVLCVIVCVFTVFRAQAQPRYSVNALGYVDVNLVAGQNFVANPLSVSDFTVSNLFRGVPDGSYFQRWNEAAGEFDPTNWFSTASGWSQPEMRLLHPQGGVLWVPSSVRVSFAGEVPQSTFCVQHLPGSAILGVFPGLGCNIVCNNIIGPCPGDEVPDGTEVAKWNKETQDFEYYIFIEGFGWAPETPTLNPGEAAKFSVPGPYYVRPIPTGGTPAAPVRLSSWQRDDTGMSAQIEATNSNTFNILRSFDLRTNLWEVVGQGSVSATGSLATITLPAGTNPTAFFRLGPPFPLASAVLLTGTRGSNRFECEFYAPVNASYALQRALSLQEPSPVWQTVAIVQAGPGNLASVIDDSALASHGYYRLQY